MPPLFPCLLLSLPPPLFFLHSCVFSFLLHSLPFFVYSIIIHQKNLSLYSIPLSPPFTLSLFPSPFLYSSCLLPLSFFVPYPLIFDSLLPSLFYPFSPNLVTTKEMTNYLFQKQTDYLEENSYRWEFINK